MVSEKNLKLKIACGLILLGLSINSCTYDSRNEKEISPCNITSTVSFQINIKPILNTNCISCHSSSDAAGGLSYESYNGVNGPAIDGRLIGSIKHLAGVTPMPQFAPKLSDCDIMKIETWIKQGALNN
ncbi:MAG TPA: cytochrome c [Cyclobacteriaceae bacterium]|nr:cytochrome c [Cyclobacteriaceae bacterium]